MSAYPWVEDSIRYIDGIEEIRYILAPEYFRARDAADRVLSSLLIENRSADIGVLSDRYWS